MSYISAERFLSLDESIQKVFIEFIMKNGACLSENNDEFSEDIGCCGYGFFNKKTDIPLLQMHQLIDFIEEKTKGMVTLSHLPIIEGEYNVIVYDWTISTETIYNEISESFLKALWKVACKIAKEKP